MTYTLTIPIEAPTLPAACAKAWDLIGHAPGTPYTVRAERPAKDEAKNIRTKPTKEAQKGN